MTCKAEFYQRIAQLEHTVELLAQHIGLVNEEESTILLSPAIRTAETPNGTTIIEAICLMIDGRSAPILQGTAKDTIDLEKTPEKIVKSKINKAKRKSILSTLDGILTLFFSKNEKSIKIVSDTVTQDEINKFYPNESIVIASVSDYPRLEKYIEDNFQCSLPVE